MLKIAANLSLPLEAVTSTFGLLAVRGAGKSNAARVMAEEMFAARLPFVYIDPVGSAYGLRSGRDGKPGGGLPIPIFGGKHGDVPLERGAGELIADLIVERRLSCVVDVSELDSEADKKAFLLAFARRLYKRNQDPLHLFLEECDDYIPQKPMRDETQLLRAWENIVRRGRARGIGCTIITQRSAAVNKMVLTQVETLFVLRTTGPQDIAAIEAWTKYHQVGSDLLKSLAGLADGESWAWSPHFLKTPATRFRFRRCDTFDSGATPKNVRSKDARKPATLADVDLEDLKGRIADTVERAKENDPRVLKARIAELEKQLRAKTSTIIEKKQPKPIFDRSGFKKIEDAFGDEINAIRDLTQKLAARIDSAETRIATPMHGFKKICEAEADARRERETIIPPSPNTLPSQPLPKIVSGGIQPMERKVLAALKKHGTLSLDQVKILIACQSTGSMRNVTTSLRNKGFVVGMNDAMQITATGSVEAGDVEKLPGEGKALFEYWMKQLTPLEGNMLSVWVKAHPKPVALDSVAQAVGTTLGSARNVATKLRTIGIIVGKKNDNVTANERLVG